MIRIGTTGEEMPVAKIPGLAISNGAVIIEINSVKTCYIHYITDIFISGKAGEVPGEFADQLLNDP